MRSAELKPPSTPYPSTCLEMIVKSLPTGSVTSPNRYTTQGSRPASLETSISLAGLGLEEYLSGHDSTLQGIISAPIGEAYSPGERRKSLLMLEKISSSDQAQSIIEVLKSYITQLPCKCDRTLESVQISLTTLQSSLGSVSAEIETLQSRSNLIHGHLSYRRSVENLLGPALEELSIPPAVILKLSEGLMDQDWLQSLSVLAKRLELRNEGTATKHRSKQDGDILLLLDTLKTKTIERIRDYLVQQIRALRSPSADAQFLQQYALLPFKEVQAFLARYQPRLAAEIIQAYSNTMRWYYVMAFRRYRHALQKDGSSLVKEHETVGMEMPLSKGSQISQQPFTAPTTFLLGRRFDILSNADSSDGFPDHSRKHTKMPIYIEVPFRAFTVAIADNASAEYAFMASFLPATSSFTSLSRTFSSIFEPCFKVAESFLEYLATDSNDSLGLLLCIRIMQQQAFTLQRRKCPVTESWINSTNMILWPKFQAAMDANVASLRRATASLSSGSRTALALSSPRHSEASGNVAPTVITQRFGQFMQSILTLSSSTVPGIGSIISPDTEPVARSLHRIRGEFEAFLIKASNELGPPRRRKFLSNNYSLLRTIVGEHEGTLAQEQLDWMAAQLLEAKSA